jgi:hypothetical protein
MAAFREKLAAGVNNDDGRHRSLGGVFSLTHRSKVRFRGGKPENICSVRALPVGPNRSYTAQNSALRSRPPPVQAPLNLGMEVI